MNVHKHAQLLLFVLISVAFARAQSTTTTIQSSPTAPLAPLPSENDSEHSMPGSAAVAGDLFSHIPNDQSSPQAEPDTHVLSGAEIFGLGSARRLVSIFDPALRVSEFGQTGIVAGQILRVTSLGGTLTAEHHWGHYHLIVVYNGAETIYEPSSYGIQHLPYHDGGISQEILLGRWTLRLRDDVFYSWGSGFSGLFAGGPAQAGTSALNGIQPSLASTGTIQTGLVRQLNDTALGEADYAFSRRTTVTFGGAYSLMNFLDPGYLNSDDINGWVGYNYALSAKNNIALTYGRNRMNYAGASNRLESDSAQMAFGRKITGRLAFQVAAGPQLLHFENFGLAKTRQFSWSASSALRYQWGRTGYSLSYFHGTTAGSGIFFGSRSDTITATANREIIRFWSASVNGGYAVNKALVPVATLANQFENWFAGATLSRQIGVQVHLGVSYAFQQQTTGGGGCPVLSCGLPGSFSQFGVSLQWHPLARGK